MLFRSDGGNLFWNGTQLNLSSAPDHVADADGDTKIEVEQGADEDMIRFNVSGTEAMIIDNVGNIGVGVGSPKAKIHVAGDVGLGNGSPGDESVVTVFLTNNTGANSLKGEIVIVDAGADNSFVKTATPGHNSVIGVVYESGIPNGQSCKVAIAGIVSVIADASTLRGQHCVTGSNPGSAGSVASPSAGTSIGLWLENVPASSLGKVLLR